MKRFFNLVCLSLLSLLLSVAPSALAQNPSTVTLTILHMNDLHGHILPFVDKSVTEKSPVGGAAYFARMIEEERAANPEGTLLLAAGDMFQGTPVSNVFKGSPVIEIMNFLRFDGSALGNHEFDWGQETLGNMLSGTASPFLACNIRDKAGSVLKGTLPYVTVARKDLKIAIIGVTTPETAYTTKPDNVIGLTFLDPIQVLPEVIKEVREKGAKFVIVLSHLGLNQDKNLAERVPGIDVIVGGHSHTVLTNPQQVGSAIIVQAGYYGLYLGVLQIEIEKATGKVVAFTRANELRPVLSGPDCPYDEKVAEIVNKYNDMIKTEFSKVVGETSVDLIRRPSEESNIGDLLCDAMKEATGADMAFQNGGGIRSDLNKGKVTMNDVYTLLPFDNVLVVMTLSGSQILKVMEQNATPQERILQVAGIKVEYDVTKPVGSRVVKVSVGGAPLDTSKDYRVAVNDFLAAGGDHFTTFKDGRDLVYGSSLRDMLVDYLSRHSPVDSQIDNRITFIK